MNDMRICKCGKPAGDTIHTGWKDPHWAAKGCHEFEPVGAPHGLDDAKKIVDAALASPSAPQPERRIVNGNTTPIWKDAETGQYIAEFMRILESGPTEEEAIKRCQLVAVNQAKMFAGEIEVSAPSAPAGTPKSGFYFDAATQEEVAVQVTELGRCSVDAPKEVKAQWVKRMAEARASAPPEDK